MQLRQALRLSKKPRIAFVGAGGKTTAISILAKEISGPVIVTTTTHLGSWQSKIADRHIILHSRADLAQIDPNLDGITLITQGLESDRLLGLDPDRMNAVFEFCENQELPLIIESDGSRQLPIKAPGPNEPVIPGFVDHVAVVMGMSGIGKPLNRSNVHRPEVYAKLCDMKEEDNLTIESSIKYLMHEQGGLKNIPPQARRSLILNQVDTANLQSQSGRLAKSVERSYDSIIVSELIEHKIHCLLEPTAGIILAAGPSSRFGQPKQLLDYQGIPFIRSVVLSAINANLSPIIVITGANSNDVENAIIDLTGKVTIVHNPNWQSGQSTSIRSGIETLSKPGLNDSIPSFDWRVGSAIFLLADQPQVNPTIITALVEEHERTLAPVIAPLINGQRGNPVIFDKVTFSELLRLQGDMGGRGIFSNFPPRYIAWHDDFQLMDVDTKQDYERLLIE